MPHHLDLSHGFVQPQLPQLLLGHPTRLVGVSGKWGSGRGRHRLGHIGRWHAGGRPGRERIIREIHEDDGDSASNRTETSPTEVLLGTDTHRHVDGLGIQRACDSPECRARRSAGIGGIATSVDPMPRGCELQCHACSRFGRDVSDQDVHESLPWSACTDKPIEGVAHSAVGLMGTGSVMKRPEPRVKGPFLGGGRLRRTTQAVASRDGGGGLPLVGPTGAL